MRLQNSGSGSALLSPDTTWRKRLPFYYGWVVVASLFLALVVSYGIYYSFSVFYVAMLEEYGWSRAGTAGVFSLFVVVISMGGAVAGTLIDRFGPSKVVPAGAILLAVGLVATSRLTELWQFYLYFGVISGLGLSCSGWVPAVTLVNRWFADKRGSAMGIASAGIGMGTVMVVPFVQYLISGVGWRSAFLVLAGFSLVLIAPQAALLLMAHPNQLGLKPDGDSLKGESPPRAKRSVRPMVVVDHQWASRPWTVASAVATRRFWLLGSAMFLGVLTNQMLWVHQAAYLVDNGYDKMLAASMVGLAGFASMPAKILWGNLADRLGREPTYTMGGVTMLVAIGVLVLTGMIPQVWLVPLFAVAFGLGYAVTAPILPISVADVFGGRHFGSIFGTVNLGQGLGAAFGAWFAGYIFDITGSYLLAFAAGALSCSFSSIALWIAAPRRVRRPPSRAS